MHIHRLLSELPRRLGRLTPATLRSSPVAPALTRMPGAGRCARRTPIVGAAVRAVYARCLAAPIAAPLARDEVTATILSWPRLVGLLSGAAYTGPLAGDLALRLRSFPDASFDAVLDYVQALRGDYGLREQVIAVRAVRFAQMSMTRGGDAPGNRAAPYAPLFRTALRLYRATTSTRPDRIETLLDIAIDSGPPLQVRRDRLRGKAWLALGAETLAFDTTKPASRVALAALGGAITTVLGQPGAGTPPPAAVALPAMQLIAALDMTADDRARLTSLLVELSSAAPPDPGAVSTPRI